MEIELIKESEIRETCDMIAEACKHSDFSKFYPQCSVEYLVEDFDYAQIKRRAEQGHFYVAKENDRIVGCGCIDAYSDSLTEGRISAVFVAPENQKKGVGRRIIEFLEKDEFAVRAHRIEIRSAISAIPFYRKLGYEHKSGQLCYYDGTVALEKFL